MGKYLDSLGLSHLIGLIKTALSGKQATLVSGTNIKTINNESLLGSGNISVSGGGSDVTGVKGNSESTYRTGNVNLTAANIGAAAASHSHPEYFSSTVNRTANTVLAAPNGSNGTASFRSLVLADLPSAVQDKLNSIESGNAEIHINSLNGLRRLTLTTGNNLRVDTRASTSDEWTNGLYYPGVAPISETKIANVITQTSTQSTNNPITAAKYYKVNSVSMVEITFKPAAARSAGSAISLGTIVSGKRPHLQAFGGSDRIMGSITSAGVCNLYVRTALTANTAYTIGFTYTT